MAICLLSCTHIYDPARSIESDCSQQFHRTNDIDSETDKLNQATVIELDVLKMDLVCGS